MRIETVVVGPIETNCYLVEDEGELMVVDPGARPDRILKAVGERKVRCIVITHGHFDHIDGLTGVLEATGAPVYAGARDADSIEHPDAATLSRMHPYGKPEVARRLVDGDTVQVGSLSFEVIETPGHTPGCICLYCASEAVMFSGDTVFAHGRFGRTDFENGSMKDMAKSLERIATMIPDETRIFPGHEDFSTMRVERKLNPYFARA